MKKRVTVSWSGGKDSAFALHKIKETNEFEIVNLHTVINEETKRVGMHGVRETLIESQADSLGLPLKKLYLEASENHEAYKKLMRGFYEQCADDKIDGIIYGDIFLEDLKTFREQLLLPSGLQSFYPLWKNNTNVLIKDFIRLNFKTVVCSANAAMFAEEQMGKIIDNTFLQRLPSDVDPCGENGEFHTFVYDGPIFKKAVRFKAGDVVKKVYSYQIIDDSSQQRNIETAFWFQDLLS